MISEIFRIVVKYGEKGNSILYEDKDYFLDKLELFSFEDNDLIEFHFISGEIAEVEYGLLEKFINDYSSLTEIELEKYKILQNKDFNPPIILTDINAPEMDFFDITETELFDFHPIGEGFLNDVSQGIWTYYGLRKFKFSFINLNLDMLNKDNFSTIVAFVKKDNQIIENPILSKGGIIRNKKVTDNLELITYIDSDDFGHEFTDSTQHMKFIGSVELTYNKQLTPQVKYIFPIQLVFHNSNYYKDEKQPCPLLSKRPVSIDFGTSSTCVAVNNGDKIELLTLSSENLIEEFNVFENPTSIMVYNWENIYSQWKKENNNFPIISKGNLNQYKYKEKDVDFDIGYTVNDVLKEAETTELNAILTEIKLIVYSIEQGYNLEIFPFIKNGTEVIKLVTSPEEENEHSLDPVAFYGYLLGRAINNPSQAKIYTNFEITYPVKFNNTVRKKLKTSLEYGLKRAVPLPLREAVNKKNKPIFKIEMKYPEPVAYVGAICGNHLKAEYGKPELFAVYDFGGGTLDSSFGMFHIDEDDEGIIEIFGVDGDEKIGGETLISQISYWIYENNIQLMKDFNIPFIKPEQEQVPNDFPSKLLNKSNIAKSNLRKIDELFSRKLFKNEIDYDQSSFEEEIELLDETNKGQTIEIRIEYDILNDKLKQIIETTIISFSESIQANFNRKSNILNQYGVHFDISKVNIYKSGNASRNSNISNLMEVYFPDNNIFLIDEVADEINNKKYAITPKTAVAFGQLRLSNFIVNGCEETPFKWNIYKENKGNGTFKEIITKNCENKNWISYGIIRGDEMEIYCSNIIAKTRQDQNFPIRIELDNELDKAYLHLRMNDETSIEYIICENKDDKPDNSLPVNSNNIIFIESK